MDELFKKVYKNYKTSRLINHFNKSSNREKVSKNSESATQLT